MWNFVQISHPALVLTEQWRPCGSINKVLCRCHTWEIFFFLFYTFINVDKKLTNWKCNQNHVVSLISFVFIKIISERLLQVLLFRPVNKLATRLPQLMRHHIVHNERAMIRQHIKRLLQHKEPMQVRCQFN